MPRKSQRTRRGRGEGSVYKEGGRWKAIITIGYDENGRRKRRKVSGATKNEVLQKLAKLHGQSIDGTLTEASTATVAQFLKQWLNDCCKATVRESTFVNYETQIRLHINPRIGGIRQSRLTPAHIQAMLGDMQRSGRSGRSANL